jgi:protein transport protein SEC24
MEMAWEAVGRVRLSVGFKQLSCMGNILIKAKTADLLSLPVMDEDRVFVYEFEKDETPGGEQARRVFDQRVGTSHLFIQTALLYTAIDGTRRIRVHNSAYPVTNMLSEPLETFDVNALTLFIARQSLSRISTVPNINSARAQIEMTCSGICRAI